jgi:hypothetical protein
VASQTAVQPNNDQGLPPLQQAIHDAIAKRWPDGIPRSTSVKDRNSAICRLLNRSISDDTFERYFRKNSVTRKRVFAGSICRSLRSYHISAFMHGFSCDRQKGRAE